MRFILFLVIFFITSCDSSKKIESMKIGSKETKFLEIKHFPDNLKASIMQGPTELSLVRSGLDDTMRTGYKAMSDRFHSDKRIKSLRMASMVIAIERIAESYVSLGI